MPFEPTHAAMANLTLTIAICRRMCWPPICAGRFSGIVAGNVKEQGIRLIEENGPFEIHAAPEIAAPLDELLRGFVAERRMKLSANTARATASSD